MIWWLPTPSSMWHPGTTPWNTWKRCAPSTDLQVGSLWAYGHCLGDFMMRCWWDLHILLFGSICLKHGFLIIILIRIRIGEDESKRILLFSIDMCTCDQVLGFSGAAWIHELDKGSYDVLRNVWQVFESMVWYMWRVLELIYILSCRLNYIISPTSGMSM